MTIKIRSIKEISKKIDFILSPIAREMYPKGLEGILRSCNHETILSFANTVLDLYSYADIPHRYIWNMPSFENGLKKIKGKTIKKDMSSSTYRQYVEQMIGCCYPSAFPYFGFMLILNIDYHTNWEDIYNYFALCAYEPEYREKYRYRPERQVKVYKPLTDNMVRTALEDSGFSKMKLSGNIGYLYNNDRGRFQGFIHILCGLQALREDHNFFDKQLLKKIADDYWDREYEKTLTEADRRALYAGDEIDYLESLIVMVETEQDLKDFEVDGEPYYREIDPDRDYDKEIRQLKEQVKEIERFVEQYNTDYEEQIKYIYNGFGDETDIWPTDEQCNALWQTYHNTNNVLLNTIAVLVHAIPKKDWGRIIAYYAIEKQRIMLAEYPILDKDSGDPFIVHPKLQRPITNNLIRGLTFSPKYNGVTMEQLDIRWEKTENTFKRQALMFIMYVLQFNGVELIKPDIFSEVFKKQIESDKNGGAYSGIEDEMIDDVLKNICNGKKDDVCKIAILLDKGYQVEEIGEFFQERLLGK